jgi:hypothetical protein
MLSAADRQALIDSGGAPAARGRRATEDEPVKRKRAGISGALAFAGVVLLATRGASRRRGAAKAMRTAPQRNLPRTREATSRPLPWRCAPILCALGALCVTRS